jgi:hypothetical protein
LASHVEDRRKGAALSSQFPSEGRCSLVHGRGDDNIYIAHRLEHFSLKECTTSLGLNVVDRGVQETLKNSATESPTILASLPRQPLLVTSSGFREEDRIENRVYNPEVRKVYLHHDAAYSLQLCQGRRESMAHVRLERRARAVDVPEWNADAEARTELLLVRTPVAGGCNRVEQLGDIGDSPTHWTEVIERP